MKINLRGIKVEITDGIREHIQSKIKRLDRYFNNPDNITANVIVRIRNIEQIVEVTVPTDSYTIRSEESHSDLYAAVDLVIDKLERQIRKNKTKMKKRYQNTNDINLAFEIEDQEETEESEFKIVKRKKVDSKPMSEEEAVLQMNLLNHDFFLFKNVDEDCYSVVYQRKDGQYGIINAK